MKQPSKKPTNGRFGGINFRVALHKIADIKFPNKDSVTTQAFAFSRFKKQTPKSSS